MRVFYETVALAYFCDIPRCVFSRSGSFSVEKKPWQILAPPGKRQVNWRVSWLVQTRVQCNMTPVGPLNGNSSQRYGHKCGVMPF